MGANKFYHIHEILPIIVVSKYPHRRRKSNNRDQAAEQRFSLKQWFAGSANSRRLRKTGSSHCYVRVFTDERLTVGTSDFESLYCY